MNNKNESRRRMPAKLLAFFMCACLLSQTALAAVTVESKLVCGKDAHTHADSCYGRGEQTCALEEAESLLHGRRACAFLRAGGVRGSYPR